MTTRRDEGSALLLVIAAMTVAMLVVSVALHYGLQNNQHAKRSTAWYQAFAAAQAGVDDYLARLNELDTYWQTVDCDNDALKGATTRANSCGWNASTEPGWLDVPGSTNAQFHYDVDTSNTHVDGTVDLVATGRIVGSGETSTRSLQVTLRRGGFGEFLYYTVYETKDPADYSNPTEKASCARYAWANPARPGPSTCTVIAFSGDDVINGPLHTNDTMLLRDNSSRQGPHFKGTVTTSRPACRDANGPAQAYKCYTFDTYSSVHPRFDKGIAYREVVEIPESIGDLRKYVTPGLDPEPPLGCLYTGPTRIQFIAPSGSGPATMRVWSRWSKTLNPGCGNPNASWPQVVNVPQNNLIMVQDVPASQAQPTSGACPARSIDATGTWNATGTTTTNGSIPQSGDYNNRAGNPDANCRYGTVYLDGTLKGRVTISADNNIVVVGNVTYHGGQSGTDALGLVSSNSVQIYHPVTTVCTREDRYDNCVAWGPGSNMNRPSSLGGTVFRDAVLQAAILTLQHSFEVQEYDVGSGLGKLTIFGTIAQRFRGAVGTSGGTGYDKNYNYDSRLRYAPPPYFLDPVRSSWGMKTFGEISPRYDD